MSQTVWSIFSFFWVIVTLVFHVWIATHILQFCSGIVPFNFVWLSHNAYMSHNETASLLVFFYFIHYPYVVWTATPFCLFIWWNFEISCVSPLLLYECHTRAFPFSLCECHTNILVYPLLLSGHSTLYPFIS